MTIPLGDAEIMAKVRDGHVEMLAILFERHHVKLYNFFLRLTGKDGHSEDLVQDVFLRMLKYRQSFRASAPFAPWMFQIARNVHLSHLRALHPTMPFEEKEHHILDSGEPPDAVLARRHDASLVKRALARLPERKREVLLLSRRSDLSYQDVATLMKCTVGAVKVQVHRAMKDLRKAFNEVQGESHELL